MSEKIVNLTQHNATPEQVAAGVFDVGYLDLPVLRHNLTFDSLADTEPESMYRRAQNIAQLARNSGATSAMIGGAAYFMPFLARALQWYAITPLHAFTQRETVEEVNEKGEAVKRSVFRHVGFVSDFTGSLAPFDITNPEKEAASEV